MASEKTEEAAENIRVAVRCRPMNSREIKEQSNSVFECDNEGNAVLINPQNKEERHEFAFDFVYGIDSKQETVYKNIGEPILDRAFDGYNGTIFAYGQTGSGKTFSMTGTPDSPDMEGLIPRMNQSIFKRIQTEKAAHPTKLFLVECSYFEIYNEIIFDLLDSNSKQNKKNKGGGLEIKEHSVLGIYVKGLQEHVVENQEQVIDLMAQGHLARTVAATNMNSESSRSHSIFTIKIHQKDEEDETKNVFAKINLVDLAGSERAASTGAVGNRLKEGSNINKSLSALGNVINALVEAGRSGKKQFIPYRNSKLTRVLQESLGGNSLCSMLATLSPANINYTETLSTLKYANRAKSIKVNARKNEESSQISQLNDEIALLKKKLQEQQANGGGGDSAQQEEIARKFEKQIQEMDEVRKRTWEDKVKLSRKHEQERKRLAKEKAMADRKTQEEKIKKWKLLQEKEDIELAIRACRDLDIGDPDWVKGALLLKTLQQEIKEQRVLIQVFKNAFDSDMKKWLDGLPDETSESLAVGHIDSKLQDILKEGIKLMEMEAQVITQGQKLDDQTQALFEAHFLAPLPEDASKEAKVKYDDHQYALTITAQLVKKYASILRQNVSTERAQLFQFENAAHHVVRELTKLAHPENATTTPEVKDRLSESQDVLRQVVEQVTHQTKAEAETFTTKYTRKGEDHPLGLKSGEFPHDRFLASTHRSFAALARLDQAQACWFPSPEDKAPWLQVDFHALHFVQQVCLQGGRRSITAAAREGDNNLMSSSELSGPFSTHSIAASKASAHFPLTMFTKKKVTEWIEAYPLAMVKGEAEEVYAMAGKVFSWEGLLKTDKIPTKLFGRPPVRFLHDVFSIMIKSTGYASEVLTLKEMDYEQLISKQEKMDYLNKIIEHVRKSFPEDVGINVMSAQIVAGQEVSETLKFLCYFSLATFYHLRDHLTDDKSEQPTQSSNDLDAATESSSSEITGWVTKVELLSSQDGIHWVTTGELTGTLDADTATPLCLPNTFMEVPWRYIRLKPLAFHRFAAMRLEIIGGEAIETEQSKTQLALQRETYRNLVKTLHGSVSLISQQLKAQVKTIRETQKAKQEHMDTILQQVEVLQKKNESLENELIHLKEDSQTRLHERDEFEISLKQAEKKIEVLIGESDLKEEAMKNMKHQVEKLRTSHEEVSLANKKLKQSNNDFSSTIEIITKAKKDLETMCDGLRIQLSENSGSSRITDTEAKLESELLKAREEIDEIKRSVFQAENGRKESEEEKEKLEKEVKDLQTTIDEQSKQMHETEQERKSFQARLFEMESRFERDEKIKRELMEKEKALESAFKKSEMALLETQAALQVAENKIKDLNVQISDMEDNPVSLMEGNSSSSELQAAELRLQADKERLEAKCSNLEDQLKDAGEKMAEVSAQIERLNAEKAAMEEMEDELNNQLQVLTEERDASRTKEEELFSELSEKQEELERIRDGYVWVTDRMNQKEDELADVQEDLEKYQSLLQTTSEALKREQTSHGVNATSSSTSVYALQGLYKLIASADDVIEEDEIKLVQMISEWILAQRNISASSLKSAETRGDKKRQKKMKHTRKVRDGSGTPEKPLTPQHEHHTVETKAESIKSIQQETLDLPSDVGAEKVAVEEEEAAAENQYDSDENYFDDFVDDAQEENTKGNEEEEEQQQEGGGSSSTKTTHSVIPRLLPMTPSGVDALEEAMLSFQSGRAQEEAYDEQLGTAVRLCPTSFTTEEEEEEEEGDALDLYTQTKKAAVGPSRSQYSTGSSSSHNKGTGSTGIKTSSSTGSSSSSMTSNGKSSSGSPSGAPFKTGFVTRPASLPGDATLTPTADLYEF